MKREISSKKEILQNDFSENIEKIEIEQSATIKNSTEQKEKAKYLGITNLSKKYSIDDMVKGDVIFCATGVTGGELVDGIKDFGESFESETYVMHFESKLIKKIKNISKK